VKGTLAAAKPSSSIRHHKFKGSMLSSAEAQKVERAESLHAFFFIECYITRERPCILADGNVASISPRYNSRLFSKRLRLACATIHKNIIGIAP
jgi:hypothetical protein